MMGAILSRDRPEAKPALDTFGYLDGLDAVVRAQAQWSELFETFDVVLAPPFGAAAFLHTDEADFLKRRLTINGEATSYGAQIAWGAIATFPGLPATCAPIAKTKSSLPVGVQIIGPRFEDRTPIAFAGLIEREYAVE
jgi:amidase